MNKISHNNHIQSLRAVAVISVILFHTNSDIFKTGYLGVDIFFVISGYLICKVLFKHNTFDKKSLFKFYVKRTRRTIPALLVVIVISIPFFLSVLMPVNLKDYGQSLVFTPIFLSNLLFGSENSYWGAISELKPLLHTWSLSIEWQFYILFPFIFFFKKKFKIFLTLFLISYISNILINYDELQFYINNHKIRIDNFFITSNRIWEFVAGACLYSIEKKYNSRIYKNNFFSFLGLLLIFLSFYFFDGSAREKIYINLIPVIGTCLFILFTKNENCPDLYKNKLLLHIGLISYSLYLWHQPILAFFKSILNNNISSFYYILIYIVIYVFSFFSYYFIEKLFYEKKLLKDKTFLTLISLISLAIIFTGLIISSGKLNYNNIVNKRITNIEKKFPKLKDRELAQHVLLRKNIKEKEYYNKFTDSKKYKIFIFGDSHSRDLILMLNFTDETKKIFEFSLLDYEAADAIMYSSQIYEDDINKIENLKTIKRAKEDGKKIIIVSRAAEFYSGNINPLVFNLSKNSKNIDAYSNLEKKFIDRNFYNILKDDIVKINNKVKEKVKDIGGLYLDRVDLACDILNKNCHSMTNDGYAIYWDHSHLTWEGVYFFSDLIDDTKWFFPVQKFLKKK